VQDISFETKEIYIYGVMWRTSLETKDV